MPTPSNLPPNKHSAHSSDLSPKRYRFWKAVWFLVATVAFLGGAWVLFGQGASDDKMVKDDGKSVVYELVRYETTHWQASPKLPMVDSRAVIRQVGHTATQETGLDIKGQTGVLYRYHNKHEPPMYVIDSDDFFELAWYYAAPTDSDAEKQASLRYAQVAYGVATSVLGQSGAQLMVHMLNHPSLSADIPKTNPANLPKTLVVSECQYHLCRLVFDKQVW